jgi:ribosomal protein S18 acetylase RimI-like enzyme
VFSDEEIRVALELVDGAIDGDYLARVAVIGDEVGGYFCAGRAPLTRATWYLYWICVDPRRQGIGIARHLQRALESAVITQGGERIVLETSGRRDYARARAFYERGGFVQAGHITDFYAPGDDLMVFTKVLRGRRGETETGALTRDG